MQIKTYQPFKWMVTVLSAAMLFLACSSGETKTTEKTTDSAPATVKPADSSATHPDTLPPLDSSATTRPENRKA